MDKSVARKLSKQFEWKLSFAAKLISRDKLNPRTCTKATLENSTSKFEAIPIGYRFKEFTEIYNSMKYRWDIVYPEAIDLHDELKRFVNRDRDARRKTIENGG